MLYEYRCETCGKAINREMAMADEHPSKIKCPDCNTKTALRVYSNVSTHIPYDFNSPDNRIKTEKKAHKKYY